MQLIAIAIYPNLYGPVVDFAYRMAQGRYRLHGIVSNDMPAGDGEEVD